jgi:UDP-GlcNAc:undecaprenyl-phosphate GlcNAc-1-phosphate transferase
MNEIILVLAFALSLGLSLYGTPVTQKVAERYGILDHPDGVLKRHRKPIPYMGGVIIYFAFISPVSLMFQFNSELLGILFAGSILLVVGLFDDLKAITPGIKFLFQVVATYILLKSGIRINLFLLPPWLNTALSFAWMLTVINAFNIIDIMDGLASSVGVLTSLTIFVISLYNDNFLISILSLSLAAALLGFLKFNWEPARIYLGDAGSMFIGMVIGALVIMGDYSRYNDLAFISGITILSIPLFDLVYVMILRILKGKSPFFGSPDHFTLRLKKKFSHPAAKTVSLIIAIQLVLSAVVILNFYTDPIVTIISTLALVLFFAIFGLYLAQVNMQERKTDKRGK